MSFHLPSKLKYTLITNFIFSGIIASAHAGPILLQDTYTESGKNSSYNYGGNPSLKVASDKTSFLQFAVNSDLPFGTKGRDVAKATLKLFVNSVEGNGSFKVNSVDTSWIEASINATNQPFSSQGVTGPITVNTASSQNWISIDITNQMREWLDGISLNNGLALIAADGTISVSFDSKESTTTSHAPEIEIIAANVSMESLCNALGWRGITNGCLTTLTPIVAPNATITCYDDPTGTLGVGVCHSGTKYFTNGVWSACIGEVLPGTEICNGLDDNCNGVVDEGLNCQLP
jgi:hypothetical protein